MTKNQKLKNFFQKTISLEKNYKTFLLKKNNLEFSSQSNKLKKQERFFLKKSFKNLLQFLFKKGEKKKTVSMLKQVFLPTSKNTTSSNINNYNFYKTLYKIFFSNTPYINLLKVTPQGKKRRGSKRRKSKKKILVLVPIINRVQKRIQANWFLNSIIRKNNQNLVQNFINELNKIQKSEEWVLKESLDFYNLASETFMRYGRKYIKRYKKKKFMKRKKSLKKIISKTPKKNLETFQKKDLKENKNLENKQQYFLKKKSLNKLAKQDNIKIIKNFIYLKKSYNLKQFFFKNIRFQKKFLNNKKKLNLLKLRLKKTLLNKKSKTNTQIKIKQPLEKKILKVNTKKILISKSLNWFKKKN